MSGHIPQEINELRNLLKGMFSFSEFVDLCLDMGIDYREDLGLAQGVANVNELVLHCHRQERVPELVWLFRKKRPKTEIPQSIIAYVKSLIRRQCDEWLRRKGFEINPFSPDIRKAEDDPLFVGPDEFSFVVYPADIFKFLDTSPYSGVHAIFAPTGGGKTSLRLFLRRKYETDLGYWYQDHQGGLGARILPVEYIAHDYPLSDGYKEGHIKEISRLLRKAALKYLKSDRFDPVDNQFQLDVNGPVEQLIEEIHDCPRRWGLKGVCFLIDNLERQSGKASVEWEFFEPLITCARELAAKDGISFIFFYPIEFLPFARDAGLPDEFIHELTWTEEQLQDMLDRRLAYCETRERPIIPVLSGQMPVEAGHAPVDSEQMPLAPGRGAAGVTFVDLFGTTERAERVKKEMISFGKSQGSPYHMWRLGHAIIEEHLGILEGRHQPFDARIRYEVVDKALGTLTRSEMTAQSRQAPAVTDDRLAAMLDAVERLIVAIDGLTDAIRGSSNPARPE